MIVAYDFAALMRPIRARCEDILQDYLREAEAYCNWQKVHDGADVRDPDESFMRAIETEIFLEDRLKKAFREEVLIRLSAAKRRGGRFTLETHTRLEVAIRKYVLHNIETEFEHVNKMADLRKMLDKARNSLDGNDVRGCIQQIRSMAEFAQDIDGDANA